MNENNRKHRPSSPLRNSGKSINNNNSKYILSKKEYFSNLINENIENINKSINLFFTSICNIFFSIFMFFYSIVNTIKLIFMYFLYILFNNYFITFTS
jgi:hypothetical protein